MLAPTTTPVPPPAAPAPAATTEYRPVVPTIHVWVLPELETDPVIIFEFDAVELKTFVMDPTTGATGGGGGGLGGLGGSGGFISTGEFIKIGGACCAFPYPYVATKPVTFMPGLENVFTPS